MAKKVKDAQSQEAGSLRITLNFPAEQSRKLREQAGTFYIPVTQYIKSIILKHLDQPQ